MAATVSSPWSKPGAWALDAEEHETELQQQPNDNSIADFPSLAVAATTKQPKKKKNQPLSLAEFTTSYGGGSTQKSHQQQPKGLTHEDLLNLPTGPRQRSAEELERSRLGGGFRSYGLSNRHGDDSSNSRGAGNSRVLNRDASREHAPSRADEIDDWSKTKKSPIGSGYERRERGSFFESQSRADESDSWVANKPSEPPRRFGSSSGGFDRRGSFDSLSRDRSGVSQNGSGGADSDNWGRKKDDNIGTMSASSRPKLVLQPRSLPVTNGNEVVAKPKGSSPFGDARPREEVLAEKGKDWKEIDEKLKSVKIGSNNDAEKSEGAEASSFGWRNRGRDHVETSWRKPNVAGSNSRSQSAEKVENGHAAENGHSAEDRLSSEDGDGHPREN